MAATHSLSTGSRQRWRDVRFLGGGKIHADGAGNLTNGELVTNGVGAGATSPQAFTGNLCKSVRTTVV